MNSKVSNWTGKFEAYFLDLPYALCSTNSLEKSRKILAVSTQLKKLRKESLKFFQAFFSQLLKLRTNCEDLSAIFIFHPQFEIYVSYIHIHKWSCN